MPIRVITGNCLEVLPNLPANSVQTVVTSPPYFNLRDYAVAPTVWGGDPTCQHAWPPAPLPAEDGTVDEPVAQRSGVSCPSCGAWRGCLGLEEDPWAYVEHLVLVFQEVYRVLRADGTCWINIAGSYAGAGYSNHANTGGAQRQNGGKQRHLTRTGFKNKDMIPIPWMVAMALQADGWYLRADVIWHKLNAMPSSTSDRPSAAHEYVFLLTKSADYYYDKWAIAEPVVRGSAGSTFTKGKTGVNGEGRVSLKERAESTVRNSRSVWTINTEAYRESHYACMPSRLAERCVLAGTSAKGCCSVCATPWERIVCPGDPLPEADGRAPEKRLEPGQAGNVTAGNMGFRASRHSGQEINAWRDDHPDATMGWRPGCTCNAPDGVQPDDLDVIRTPLGSRVAPDPTLQTGRAGFNRPRGPDEGQRLITRYEQRQYADQLRASPHREEMAREAGAPFAHYLRKDRIGARPLPPDLLERWIECGWLTRATLPSWTPPDVVPCTVLDPFSGSGTTLKVAVKHGRDALGIDLNATYEELSEKRTTGVQMSFASQV